jgi:TonB family protein
MKNFIPQIIVIAMVSNCHPAISQSNESFFDACNSFAESEKRSDCEKEKVLEFINSELMPYLSKVKSTGSSYEIELNFSINAGMIDTIRVTEKHNSGIFPEENLRLSKKFQPFSVPEFNSPKNNYWVKYKLPKDESQKEDLSRLEITNWDDITYKVVERMPRFPGCEKTKGSDSEKEACAKEKMLAYIYKNLRYPEDARENEIQGQVVVLFVVEKDGSITEAKAVRDLGYGLGQAAVDVVESMNFMAEKWTPGTQRGREVRVLYTLPVKFKL